MRPASELGNRATLARRVAGLVAVALKQSREARHDLTGGGVAVTQSPVEADIALRVSEDP